MSAQLSALKSAPAQCKPTVQSVIAEVQNLLVMPDAAMQLGALLSDPNATTSEIAEVISLDPAISARVLRIASSAYFGMRLPVETITQAITVLGMRKLHLMVLATSAAQAFNNLSGQQAHMEVFWNHSVGTALAAGNLAARGMRRHRDRIFLAGLLHDIGQLVMYHQLPDASDQILEAMARGEPRQHAEHALLGFTHADLGAALLEQWQLPVTLTEPVRFHHQCIDAPNHAAEAAVVQLGSVISHHIETRSETSGDPDDDLQLNVDPCVWELSGRSPDEMQEIMAEVEMNWFEVLNLIAPDAMMVP